MTKEYVQRLLDLKPGEGYTLPDHINWPRQKAHAIKRHYGLCLSTVTLTDGRTRAIGEEDVQDNQP